ncbi:MAG: hypothetical protein ACLFV7_08465 [Phycisphaerae bacterium]
MNEDSTEHRGHERLECFRSEVVDRVRESGSVWTLPGGELRLPRVFGFCRGVERALAGLEQAVGHPPAEGGKLVLLGEVIHNPWVNDFFHDRGVHILTPAQREDLEQYVGPRDCAIIPAFGVPLPVHRRLEAIGCEVVDSTCGDVRRLWAWAERAAREGFGVAIFGRPNHDETVVTKSRLAEAGGKYVVLRSMKRVEDFCNLLAGGDPQDRFAGTFDKDETNATSLAPFEHLAQVSQTTMLYDETMEVRRRLSAALETRHGRDDLDRHALFQPTVCRATQLRQEAAVELCRSGCDLVIVVGGVGSSNTRHLFDLARKYVPAWFIEDASAIHSAEELSTFDLPGEQPIVVRDWLPRRRPLRIGVLAGASCPEIVIGRVLEKLAELLS